MQFISQETANCSWKSKEAYMMWTHRCCGFFPFRRFSSLPLTQSVQKERLAGCIWMCIEIYLCSRNLFPCSIVNIFAASNFRRELMRMCARVGILLHTLLSSVLHNLSIWQSAARLEGCCAAFIMEPSHLKRKRRHLQVSVSTFSFTL